MAQLAKLGSEGEERAAPAGAVLFKGAEESREMIFLLSGKLELRGGSGQHLADVPSGSLVGEMGVLTRSPRSATAVVVEPCTYLGLAAEDFQRLAEEDSDFGMKFYRNLCNILASQLKSNNLLVEFFQAMS